MSGKPHMSQEDKNSAMTFTDFWRVWTANQRSLWRWEVEVQILMYDKMNTILPPKNKFLGI